MRIFLDCIPCFCRQGLDSARLITDDEQVHQQIMKETINLLADMDSHATPPAVAKIIHSRIRAITGQTDPYRNLKQQNNEIALKIYNKLETKIKESNDKLLTAVKLAIAGNIIDLGVKTCIPDEEIEQVVTTCLSEEMDKNKIAEFKSQINQAEKILYLCDNAGEIVFDKLLIEQLPMEKVTAAVRGKPIINDATMEDAEFVGLTKLVKVIDNGDDSPGTILENCSQIFRDAFDAADLIISKGQGNYETLSDVDKNIFFVLKAKCPVIARDLNCNIGKMILTKSNSFQTA